ncbi:MAG TPA: EI24 domain-containing protein [Burkholderiales bacterium]|nr:EI24 domain-containing protein [Burkholderiales bacterium]
MERILEALARAFGSLLHPRMLWLMVWPVLVALAIWVAFAALYWGAAARWIDGQLHQWPFYEWAVSIWPLTLVAAWFAWLLLLFLFIPMVLITAVLIISVVSMPAMATHVGERDYAEIARRKGGTFIGSIWNAVAALVFFGLLFAVTLPLWLIPLLWPVLPIALFGYFNQRVFRYDALAEHGSAAEIAEIIRRRRGELFLLGVALALIGHIPLVGFFMPVYGGLVFIHYGLARLAELRSEPIEGSARRV